MLAFLEGLDYEFQQNLPVNVKGGNVKFVDFMCRKLNLIIEIDGPEHDKVKDDIRERQILLAYPKFSFMRFKNEQIFYQFDYVKMEVFGFIDKWKKKIAGDYFVC